MLSGRIPVIRCFRCLLHATDVTTPDMQRSSGEITREITGERLHRGIGHSLAIDLPHEEFAAQPMTLRHSSAGSALTWIEQVYPLHRSASIGARDEFRVFQQYSDSQSHHDLPSFAPID